MATQQEAQEVLRGENIDHEDRGYGYMVYGRFGRYMTPGEIVTTLVLEARRVPNKRNWFLPEFQQPTD